MIRKEHSKLGLGFCALLLVASLALSAAAFAEKGERPQPSGNTTILPAAPEICALLDNPETRALMDGLLFNLIWSCGRQDDFLAPAVGGEKAAGAAPEEALLLGNDVQVNDSTGEIGPSSTQSETSIKENMVTGTFCSAFNDSWEYYGGTGGGGLTGFARSTNGGNSWQDGGAVGSTAFGDPSLVWRQADGYFYLATLASGGALAIWVSTDDCQTFSFLSTPSTSGDDKELLAVDNNPASPYYGNLYLVWTDFGYSGWPIRATRSTDGGISWSSPTTLSSGGGVVQGAWPAVAPNGDVFVAWVHYTDYQNGPISIRVSRSTNGGLTYSPVTSPLVNAVSPRDANASSHCGRPSLNGDIRYLASPQITVDDGGNLHVVYSYDPDGFDTGDVINVYYRRSTDSGATWGPEVRLNDDTTLNDQYFPTIQVTGNTVMATWYDRRLDAGNLLQDYYKRISPDDGVTWFESRRVSDVSSPIHLDPYLATCYHGDYDQSVVTTGNFQIVQWADDRNVVLDRNDPDVWSEDATDICYGTSGQWRGCRGNGCLVCSELVASYSLYFYNHPLCSPNSGCGGLYYTCNENCPAPTSADICYGTPGEWQGCRGNGCSVCSELVASYSLYFYNHPLCSPNNGCGGLYYTCNAHCPAPTSADICYGSPGQWRGCRGNGCSVCSELVAAYPCYFQNHPLCSPNNGCGGLYYTCNDHCPAPTPEDAC